MHQISYEAVVRQLPPEWPHSPVPEIRLAVQKSGRKAVVLDDDPTGTQTVHHVPVLTEWSTNAIKRELEDPSPLFYILTNSRSLIEKDARDLAREIGRNLAKAAQESGREISVISRSDSTLRGHFPAEVTALAEGLKTSFDAYLLIPFFAEGGRVTFNNVHYLREGSGLTPVNETEFARDAVFGYQHADLRQWVQEKTHGSIKAEDVHSISIQEIRKGGPQKVAQTLAALPPQAICVVNAICKRDLEVFTLGLIQAEEGGRQFLCRTAASFVPLRAGLLPQPSLSRKDLNLEGTTGGLIVAGSYVAKTTVQLQALLDHYGLDQYSLERVEVDACILSQKDRAREAIDQAAERVNRILASGQDVVVYTSRSLVSGDDARTNLTIGQSISDGLVSIVRSLLVKPRYLLAKGGITSSDLATKALGVRRAVVIGQILAGVPVWRLGGESRFPGLDYIVFPGNVGEPGALSSIVHALRANAEG